MLVMLYFIEGVVRIGDAGLSSYLAMLEVFLSILAYLALLAYLRPLKKAARAKKAAEESSANHTH